MSVSPSHPDEQRWNATSESTSTVNPAAKQNCSHLPHRCFTTAEACQKKVSETFPSDICRPMWTTCYVFVYQQIALRQLVHATPSTEQCATSTSHLACSYPAMSPLQCANARGGDTSMGGCARNSGTHLWCTLRCAPKPVTLYKNRTRS